MTIKRRAGLGSSEENLKDYGPHFQMYLRSWWELYEALCLGGTCMMYMYIHVPIAKKKRRSESNKEIVPRHRLSIRKRDHPVQCERISIAEVRACRQERNTCMFTFFFSRACSVWCLVFSVRWVPRNGTVGSGRISKIQPRARVGT